MSGSDELAAESLEQSTVNIHTEDVEIEELGGLGPSSFGTFGAGATPSTLTNAAMSHIGATAASAAASPSADAPTVAVSSSHHSSAPGVAAASAAASPKSQKICSDGHADHNYQAAFDTNGNAVACCSHCGRIRRQPASVAPGILKHEHLHITEADDIAAAYNFMSVVAVFLAGSAASIIFALPSQGELDESPEKCVIGSEVLVALWCWVVFINIFALANITLQQYFLTVRTSAERKEFARQHFARFSRWSAVAATMIGLVLFVVALFLSAIYRLPGCEFKASIYGGGLLCCIAVGLVIIGMVATNIYTRHFLGIKGSADQNQQRV